MSVVIWCKNECFYCYMAKATLAREGIEYEERNIESGDWTQADMLESVPDAKTVPQIFIGDEYIGGFTQLQEYLKGRKYD